MCCSYRIPTSCVWHLQYLSSRAGNPSPSVITALSMLCLHRPPKPLTFWNKTPLPFPCLHFSAVLPPLFILQTSLLTSSLAKYGVKTRLKKLWRLLCFHMKSITNQTCYNGLSLLLQACAHPDLQCSSLHSTLEPDGGRPGVHLSDLPLGSLHACPVPTGCATAFSPRPRGGGVL